jgi:signal transduction histidine kinase/CheY-like chemotaxis protein
LIFSTSLSPEELQTLPVGHFHSQEGVSAHLGNWAAYGLSHRVLRIIGLLVLAGLACTALLFFMSRQLNSLRGQLAAYQAKEKTLRETEKSLRNARKAAESSNLAKSRFLANMTHEIRTPINAILGFTDMLLETVLSDHQMDYATTIKNSSNALLSVIDDILDFSKIETGELDFQAVDFDPELLAYEVCELIRPRVGQRPIEIICHIDDDLPCRVNGDPTRFRQVLTNLMGNAAKFTESGEIELSLALETETADRIKLHATVRDTGIGIPEDRLTLIFEPFRQAGEGASRKYGGTGLGLSICRQISNRMSGKVWVESSFENGSTFHFTSWLAKSEDRPVNRILPVSLAGRKALVVDDNRTNLKLLSHILSNAGMQAVALQKGREVQWALHSALKTKNPFDLCIIDIQMPLMDGYDVAKRVRDASEPFSALPLIALSSLQEEDAKKCEAAGFDAFLNKPVRREKLYSMLERILGKRESQEYPIPNTQPATIDKRDSSNLRPPSSGNPKRTPILTQHNLGEEIKHSVRILLAEDNPTNQKLAQMILTKAGYQVILAENGQVAVDKFTNSPEQFDLILMDIQMPRMDGLKATQAIREKGFTSIPIIALTAHAMKEDRNICLEAGMNDHISKPIKREIVYQKLERWVFNKERSTSVKTAAAGARRDFKTSGAL